MQIYSIKKALNITGYKIVKIISENDKEVHLRVESHKRKEFICSGCGQVHKIGYHGTEETIAVNMSVDEVSYKKYHRYLTNVVDADEKAVIWNDRGRKTEVSDRYYTGIGEDNCKRIESVALDGARTFISSTGKYAVNALIVYDKFHIIQKLNWAVDMTRKQEPRKARKENNDELVDLINCRQRFILLKNKGSL